MGVYRHRHEPEGTGQRRLVPETFVDKVKASVDIVTIIGRVVALKKAGQSLVGLCPFHTERSPSFTVSPTKQFYHCFGCGASGDALRFLMEHDSTPFREAIIKLAGDAGLALPPEMAGTGQDTVPVVDTGPLYLAMQTAEKYFAHVLRHSPTAIAYLKGRGLTQDSLQRFAIGMAPDEWRGLTEAFADYKTNTAIVLAGLVREKEGRDPGSLNRYDTFRNRITFGVRDTRGRIIAFGARVLDAGGEPKYLNSPESPIFHKSGAMFGLFEARESIRVKSLVIVVEGYMDVVMLAQTGVQNVVASMGTAFTRTHAERLLTQSQTVVFAFDGDTAGRNAAWKALETMLPMIEDVHDVRFLICPPGKDPDNLAREEGAVAFEARVREAASLSEFLISELSLKHNGLRSTEDRARFAHEASELAGRIGWGTKLRALVLEQVEIESRIPGSAIAALREATRYRREHSTLWSRLADAVRSAPSEALEQRDVLLELLDPGDPAEAGLIKVLRSLSPSSLPAQAPTDYLWLLARDALSNCIELITEYRKAQVQIELRARFSNGELSQHEFMQLSLSLEASN